MKKPWAKAQRLNGVQTLARVTCGDAQQPARVSVRFKRCPGDPSTIYAFGLMNCRVDGNNAPFRRRKGPLLTNHVPGENRGLTPSG
ncbi:hypothetical protein SAMN05421753_110118 [Planctomicrobium piriforme]|uniref:Uncharacterized protein n=1 Tax=Planctomicrobium piriforme TaxID=1576369 RepID=A0A1I3JB00_9PLAN|nr:hypothetical protein SAMN05421753_110118 [Planctomicrobium piriforme]